MKAKISLPAGVGVFAFLALAGMISILAFNVGQTTEAQATMPLQPPANLAAENTGQLTITLSWTAPTTGTGYRVERSEDGRTGWAMVGSGVTGLATTTYGDMDPVLELNTTYHYRVSTTATGPDRRSRPSNVVSARTGSVELPGAPTGLTLTEQGPSRIDLSWTAPAATGGGDITGYKIEYSDSSDTTPGASTWKVLVANTMKTTTTYSDDGSVASLDEGDRRHYRVSAINSVGAGVASTAVRSDVTPAAAGVATSAPTALVAMAMGPAQIDLSWTAPTDTSGDDITGYQIEYSNFNKAAGTWGGWDDLVETTGNDKTTYTDDGSEESLMAENTRQYRVAALVADTTSEFSNLASATTAKATVPGAPKAPTLLPTGAQAITVNWTAPTNTGGSPITGYRIERSENGSSWKVLVKDTGSLNLTHPDTEVPKANTRWHYRVSAINEEGVGMASDAAYAVTPPVSAVPAEPTDLAAWESGPTRIVLLWKAPSPTGGEITGYKIEYSADSTGPWMDLVANTMSDATTYTDNGSVARLEAGTTRYYRVSTINSFGTSASPSNVYSAVTGASALSAPSRLSGERGGQLTITLSWTAPTTGATGTGYRVERSEDGRTGWTSTAAMTISGLTTTTFSDEDPVLELNTTYHYRVSTTATGPDRRSRPSNVVSARTGSVELPGAPTGLTLTEQGPSRIDLSWTAPAATGGGDITGYKIEYSDSSDPTPGAGRWKVLVANTMKTTTTYSDDGSVASLDEGDRRHYRVSAINSAGAGVASTAVRSDVTPAAAGVATSAPTALVAMAMGPAQIDLSWTAPTDTSGDDITGYQIEYSNFNKAAGTWGGWDDLVETTGNDKTTYTDDGSEESLMAENTRQYRVAALVADTTSEFSNPASATTAKATVPGAPKAPTLLPTGAQAITVNWTAPTNTGGSPITGYRIERSENGSSWKVLVKDTESLNLTHPDTEVPKANTRWHYRVSAINEEGVGMASDAANASTYPVSAVPAEPTDLTAWESGPTRIVLLWKAPSPTGGEITGYKIEYSADSTGPWMDLVANTMSDATTYTDNGSVAKLEAGTTRYYRVSTINSFGTSASPSNVYSAVTGAMAPTLTVDGPVSASHAENDMDMVVATYTASGPGSDMATWTREGDDAGDFRLSSSSGMSTMLMFSPSPDFEMPADADGDNVYMVTVKAMEGDNMDTHDVTVTVTDVDELGMLTGDASVSQAENVMDTLGTYTISGGTMADMAKWTPMGDDAGHFMLEGSGMSRMLKFRSDPDYEMPRGMAMSDDNMNTYMVTVKAMAGGEMAMMEVTVMVTDMDEDGSVTIMPTMARAGVELTASLDDPDETTSNEAWAWLTSDAMDGTYTEIDGGTTAMYTPTADEVGTYLKARVMYTDGKFGDEEEESDPIKVLSSDASLMSLDLWRAPDDEVGNLTTTFMTGTTEYTVMALNSDESVTVKAIPTHMGATVEVNGTAVDADGTAAVDLDVGMNTITAMVTAQDGETMMTYTITVTRAASMDASLSALSLMDGDTEITLAMVADMPMKRTASVGNDVESVTVTATPNDMENAMAVIMPADADMDMDGHQVALMVGANEITVTVTAQDGETMMTYMVTVTRAASMDASLMSLDLWRAPDDEVGNLTTTFMTGTTEYTVMALNSDESVTVKAIPTHMGATVEVNGTAVDADGTAAVDLDVGMNTITAMVTAQDGETMMTYMVTVTRAASMDATLSVLSLMDGDTEIDLAMVADMPMKRTASVGNDVESVTVTATPNDMDNAMAVIMPADADMDMDGHQVDLMVGDTEITVTVTAQDGTTMMTYTITVTRAAPADPLLDKYDTDGDGSFSQDEVLHAITRYFNNEEGVTQDDVLAVITRYFAGS